MEYAVVVVIVALWVLGSLIPTGRSLSELPVVSSHADHSFPRQQTYSSYTKEDLKILHRIWATWGVEHMAPNTDALIQHFEALNDIAPYYETRKMS